MKYRVLIIDDELLIRISLKEGLGDLGYRVEVADSIGEGLRILQEFRPDAVLLDNRLGTELGMEHIASIKKLDEDIQIIMMTAYGSVSQAVIAIKKGAYDYIQKPFDLEEIDILIGRALEHLKSKRSQELMLAGQRALIGESSQLDQVKKQIAVLAQNDNIDVLIRGETGTGKEVVATLIHNKSPRGSYPMVKINCGAIPDNLLESELFGYEKGAFTGAVKTKKGLIELANGGTVFLDEIGEMPLAMQSKLLTFLEDRQFKRVGGLTDIQVNVRVFAATNRALEQAMKQGKFREDLFYRLNVMQIELPPLRDRVNDIPLLCAFYLEHFNHKFGKSVQEISPELMGQLKAYHWKGNVRELKNILERCVLFCEGSVLERTSLLEEGLIVAEEGLAYPLKDLNQAAIDLQQEVESFERQYIDKALELCGNNFSRAAQLLGCTRFTLKRKLEK